MTDEENRVAQETTQSSDLSLTTIGQFMALFVIVVPVSGYIANLVSLMLNSRLRNYDYFSLAIAHSIPWMYVVGTQTIVLAGFTVFLEHFSEKDTEASAGTSKGWLWRHLSAVLIVVDVLVLLFVNIYLALFSSFTGRSTGGHMRGGALVTG